MMLLGPGDARALDRAGAHAAAADDDDGLARADLGAVDGRAEARRQPAADERGRAEVDALVDLDDRALVDHDPLGERAELAHAVEVLVTQVVPVGAVGDHRAGEDRHAEVADVAAAR